MSEVHEIERKAEVNVFTKSNTPEGGSSQTAGSTESCPSLAAEARHWFENLSREDQVSVASFQDAAFLATFVDLVSPWSNHARSSLTTVDGRPLIIKTGATIDWKARVSVQDVERAYNSYKSMAAASHASQGKPTSDREGSRLSGHETTGRSSGGGRTTDLIASQNADIKHGENKRPDAYRIHNEKTSNADAVPKSGAGLGARHAVDISSKTEAQNESRRLSFTPDVIELIESVRVVFSSVTGHVLKRASDEVSVKKSHYDAGDIQHMITFDPAVLDAITEANFLSVLDRLAVCVSGDGEDSFLTGRRRCEFEDSSEDELSGWLPIFRHAAPTNRSATVPLLSLLLSRIEVAVYKTYIYVQGSEALELSTDASRRCSSLSALQKFGNDLQAYGCRQDAGDLRLLLVPLNKLVDASDVIKAKTDPSNMMENLVFVPISWLLRSTGSENGEGLAISTIASWNDAVDVIIRIILDEVSKADKQQNTCKQEAASTIDNSCDRMSPGFEGDGANLPESVLESHQPLGKKNKKKKKKKKRKNSNTGTLSRDADTPGLVNAVEVPSKGSLERAKTLESSCCENSTLEPVSPERAVHIDSSPSDTSSAVKTSLVQNYDAESTAFSDVPSVAKRQEPKREQKEVSAATQTALLPGTEEIGDKSSADALGTASDEHLWEMVESKNRGSRGKKQKGVSARSTVVQISSMATSVPASRKSKGGKSASSRRRNHARKMVKDILTSVLDTVDKEIKLIRQKETMAMLEEQKRRHEQIVLKGHNGNYGKASTLRDVVLGRGAEEPDVVVSLRASPQKQTPRSEEKARPKTRPSRRLNGVPVADQSTAQTFPETVSGISATTQSSVNTEVAAVAASAVDVDSNSESEPSKSPACFRPQSAGRPNDIVSPPPPLPTLFGNTNSASSSVASSLEAPHTSHHHAHCSAANENDVGYHLLDICERLSRDMDVFMKRRAAALNIRRRERGALLSALQDSATKLWSGNCHVEMYGSCATGLDLPSSDVDVVVCGLDGNGGGSLLGSPADSEETDNSGNVSGDTTPVLTQRTGDYYQSPMSSFASPYSPVVQLSPNAERVLQLAAELDRQPWAVQVKPIPTASVPVVKILADPSRLPGAVSAAAAGGVWIMQQHHIAAQAAAAAGISPQTPLSAEQGVQQASYYTTSHVPPHYQPTTLPPWRGADVMNGLFAFDITFEGPEHGGIGSTAFSAKVVQDVCDETGLPPERTPVVQVLMVLKEILAQRRLNEPFSGGLSSYALLLLVVAVMKERAAIREEIERIERQRREVAAESCSCAIGVADDSTTVRSNVRRELKSDPQHGTQLSCEVGSGRPSKKDVRVTEGKLGEAGVAEKPCNVASQASVSFASKSRTSEASLQRKDSDQMRSVSTCTTVESGSSWASIAKKNASVPPSRIATFKTTKKVGDKAKSETLPQTPTTSESSKPVSTKTFADIVSSKKTMPIQATVSRTSSYVSADYSNSDSVQKQIPKHADEPHSKDLERKMTEYTTCETLKKKVVGDVVNHKEDACDGFLRYGEPSLFPQGTNDVLEVLCSGETTAGKLLMHFLLFYGQHFDSQSTSIDVSGTHHPDFHRIEAGEPGRSTHLTPFVTRIPGGSIDPVTGMLTVDPIVVYDPLEGAENNNVARSCFAWSSIRWVFAQSYTTLSSVVERSESPTTDSATKNRDTRSPSSMNPKKGGDGAGNRPGDMVSPLLEMLLSF